MVTIRMMKLGRKHRPFFRIVAVDKRRPRDGRYIEELGTYDPMVRDTNQRVRLKPDRIKYWLSVGAQPSEKCTVLIKKFIDKAAQPSEDPVTPVATGEESASDE